MSITEKDIKKIAKLAKIAITEEEQKQFTKQVGEIIKWVEQLNEIDTNNVKELTNVNEIYLRINEDKISDGDIVEQVLSNSKKNIFGYFAVSKVIE